MLQLPATIRLDRDPRGVCGDKPGPVTPGLQQRPGPPVVRTRADPLRTPLTEESPSDALRSQVSPGDPREQRLSNREQAQGIAPRTPTYCP
jgi:hypothetical protein